ncbi:pyridoxal phosphate-dependent decarboxylase family protein [Streptomyces sp. NPDC086549]|uniref:pyridoxal phosphate-dependent decarboxylase family protein n=1 Tax=Streptomyces sp. NPDC086549 TaxID=3365752 RepID=UPI0038222A8A
MDDVNPLRAWFLGPKAENSDLFEELILDTLRDAMYWRRNYFPGDVPILRRSNQYDVQEYFDGLEENLTQLLADLRQSFPFHSPRYIGHQQSDVSMAGLLGMFAGMLYNSNNVTPQSGYVTVDWEIDACESLLEMLGYRKPPNIPTNEAQYSDYENQLLHEFGWAHLTSGGTSANIEALWVARTVRYSALAIKDAAEAERIPLKVKLPSHSLAKNMERDIDHVTEEQMLLLKPNESIYLLARFINAIMNKEEISAGDAISRGKEMLAASKYSPQRGFFEAAAKFPPCLLASGASHYSVRKAADVLGIGRDNIIFVDTDDKFRMDPSDLKNKLAAIKNRQFPIAVVAAAGTTEEGAVDPLHRVVGVRKELEEEDYSFWLHVDAAWGGYFRTFYSLRPEVEKEVVRRKLSEHLGVSYSNDMTEWHENIVRLGRAEASGSQQDEKVKVLRESLSRTLTSTDSKEYYTLLKVAMEKFRQLTRKSYSSRDEIHRVLELSQEDWVGLVRSYVREDVEISLGKYTRAIMCEWGDPEVCRALYNFPQADSITVDPHKMGYIPYSCGAVAYRNDRIRHFVEQEAPYITGATPDMLISLPPRHLSWHEGQRWADRKRKVESFGPFILEGSRPGAAAAALRLSTQVMPLHHDGHGRIIRASALAARELYEWFVHWQDISSANSFEADYEFLPYQGQNPDTNIVIFGVARNGHRQIDDINRVTEAVYRQFSISSELGEHEHSYSQPFFLSITEFKEPDYPYSTLERLFDRCRIEDSMRYKDPGQSLKVLRATVMSPYIVALRERQSIFGEFMQELDKAVRAVISGDQ